MKAIMFAAVLAIAACASAASSDAPEQTASAPSVAPYTDARSTASDADVRDARRAYRAACQQDNNDGYCECMTGGMAQALVPDDLAVATAAFTGTATNASAETLARVSATRTDVERGCVQFRD